MHRALLLLTPFLLGLFTANAQTLPKAFQGDWTLNLTSGEPAWMSLYEEDGVAMVRMRVYVGSEGPFKIEEVKDDHVRFNIKPVRKEKGSKVFIKRRVEMRYLEEDTYVGIIHYTPSNGSKMDSVTFTGNRIPPMPPAPDLSKVEFGEPVDLFNGKDLTGWRAHEADKKFGWSAQDGLLVNTTPKTDFSATGAFANLRTVDEFEDFKLEIDFLIGSNRNSGVYLRGMYEAQVVDRDSRMQGLQGVGAIFSRIAPSKNVGKPGGEWQSYVLTLVDRHVTVVLNGEKVIDNQPVIGPTGGAIKTDPMKPGPIYLQGDHTSVKFRNIRLTPVRNKG